MVWLLALAEHQQYIEMKLTLDIDSFKKRTSNEYSQEILKLFYLFLSRTKLQHAPIPWSMFVSQ
jgi:hypothetical protein